MKLRKILASAVAATACVAMLSTNVLAAITPSANGDKLKVGISAKDTTQQITFLALKSSATLSSDLSADNNIQYIDQNEDEIMEAGISFTTRGDYKGTVNLYAGGDDVTEVMSETNIVTQKSLTVVGDTEGLTSAVDLTATTAGAFLDENEITFGYLAIGKKADAARETIEATDSKMSYVIDTTAKTITASYNPDGIPSSTTPATAPTTISYSIDGGNQGTTLISIALAATKNDLGNLSSATAEDIATAFKSANTDNVIKVNSAADATLKLTDAGVEVTAENVNTTAGTATIKVAYTLDSVTKDTNVDVTFTYTGGGSQGGTTPADPTTNYVSGKVVVADWTKDVGSFKYSTAVPLGAVVVAIPKITTATYGANIKNTGIAAFGNDYVAKTAVVKDDGTFKLELVPGVPYNVIITHTRIVYAGPSMRSVVTTILDGDAVHEVTIPKEGGVVTLPNGESRDLVLKYAFTGDVNLDGKVDYEGDTLGNTTHFNEGMLTAAN